MMSTSRAAHPCIPTAVRRNGRVLLNQQLWLWGQDIRRPEGNALIEYGFTRTKPPTDQRGSNTYLLQLPCGARLVLWAFGFFYQRDERGGIFIPRFTFTPRLARFDGLPGAVWSAEQLVDCRPPRDAREWSRVRELFIPALRWVADYERWVCGARSLDYRRDCVERWRQTRIAAESLVEEWQQLAACCDVAIRQFSAARL